MRTIETTIELDDQRKATIRFPAALAPGPHRVVLVIDEPPVACTPLTFSAHDVGPWPEGFTVRREEIYGDDGR
jgi:hypothetical protein